MRMNALAASERLDDEGGEHAGDDGVDQPDEDRQGGDHPDTADLDRLAVAEGLQRPPLRRRWCR